MASDWHAFIMPLICFCDVHAGHAAGMLKLEKFLHAVGMRWICGNRTGEKSPKIRLREKRRIIGVFSQKVANLLPQKRVDAIAIRQQLLSQYDQLQCRLKELTKAAEEEVWILARMCQLENKIEVIGEPSYSARRSRVKRARESLDESLVAKLELIASYAKIASRIEIEVEMDTDVLAAESVTNAANIAEQIERLMELDDLEKLWQIQAEANDEVERLLKSEPVLPDSV